MTTQAKHTPGPWTLRLAHSIIDPGDIGIHAPKARTANIHAECFAEFWKKGDIRNDECLANAHLIAAAPDLLAALRDLVDTAESMETYLANDRCMGCQTGDSKHANDCTMEAARAAIAAAEGGAR